MNEKKAKRIRDKLDDIYDLISDNTEVEFHGGNVFSGFDIGINLEIDGVDLAEEVLYAVLPKWLAKLYAKKLRKIA